MARLLGLGVALGAIFVLSGVAAAGDETMRLDLKRSSKTTLTGGDAGVSQFTHDARAKASDDDTEDVHYGFRGGYGGYGFGRGFGYGGYGFGHGFGYGFGHGYGGYGFGRGFGYGFGYGGYGYGRGFGYFGSRFYPYGAGYWNGYYSNGYYPSYSYAPVQSYYYAPPVVSYTYAPCGGSGATAADTNTLDLQPRSRMPQAGEPPAAMPKPHPKTPMDSAYPYDGPMGTQKRMPSYRYDGGPNQPVPMPPADVNPSGSSPKVDPADGRVVKLTAAKKPTYPAYGDNRRKTESGTERTVSLKRTND